MPKSQAYSWLSKLLPSRGEGATIERRRPASRQSPHPHPRVVLTYAVLALAAAAYTVWVIVRGSGQDSTAIDNWGVAGFELLVSFLCLFRAVVNRRDRAM